MSAASPLGDPGKVHPLKDNQLKAVDPQETVWLSASAGTGKTQVLSARVLRLLLRDRVAPSQILCLTFTKAGAAEMATRVNEVLADWVRMEETQLGRQIANIGLTATPEIIAHARTLFASVLDCPGGGLRIDTIHAFSQWLLAAFPEEAGLAPGTRAMEDRDRTLLAREVLSGLLLDAEEAGDRATLDALELLSIRMGPDEVEKYLLRCTRAGDAWDENGPWAQGDLSRPVKRLIGLDEDASEADLLALCGDGLFDVDSLRVCLSAYSQWNGKKGMAGRVAIADWLAAGERERLDRAGDLFKVLFTQKDTIKDTESLSKFEEYFGDAAARVLDCMLKIRALRSLLELSEFLIPALTLGRAFHRRWQEAKAREGLIDFDDQIREAARLLGTKGLGEWIRYKLDRRFDHVLVDEAQDTNAAQWDIIFALTEEFFAGEGQRGDAIRTLFVVGDYKQAIFRFQGTSPENFALAADKVRDLMAGAAANADALRDRRNARELREYGLGQSFRTAKPILEFVDKAIEGLGHEALGLDKKPDPHEGQNREGLVTLWAPVTGETGDEGEEDSGEDEGWNSAEDDPADAPVKGEENWLARHDRALADRIAQQVAAWLDPKGPGFPLVKGRHRLAGPGDIMVLVRKRAELAGLIVARLHAAGVEVAGVDRLRLGAPLAVKDLIAALRFAVQPFDDLNLAALLVSPLLGWSQDQLLEHGYRGERVPLWSHLRSSRDSFVAATLARLLELLSRADYEPPQALLHWLLVGPWRGRERLVARLGVEANDPIDELLNAAHAYAMSDTPSIVAFLHWFDAGEGELKREAEGGGKFVRVMTVHGSKGLQAPIVILADATGDPTKARAQGIELADPLGAQSGGALRAPKLPLPYIGKDERFGWLRTAHDEVQAAELEEHWRLLYVAMTRAEEALFIGGSLKPKAKMPEQSWYARLEAVFEGEPLADPIWQSRREWGSLPPYPPRETAVAEAPRPALPDWVTTSLAPEPRPPRPLAPSSLGEERSADPPFAPGAASDAARRGTLIHKLLERLPDVPEGEREGAARRWLARSAADLAGEVRGEMAASALAVLARAEWAELFSSASLAEVPIAALVGDQVVAGTIDRLLVTADAVRLVDFKTARRPPADLAEVPTGILRQMGAYAAALEVTFPGRRIEVALLYTQAPRLIEVPAEVLAAHKPHLSTTE